MHKQLAVNFYCFSSYNVYVVCKNNLYNTLSWLMTTNIMFEPDDGRCVKEFLTWVHLTPHDKQMNDSISQIYIEKCPLKKQITTTLKCINATTDCYHWRFNQAWTSTWPCAKLSLYTTHSKPDDVIPDIARKGSIETVSYSMDVCFDDDYVGAVNHITHKKMFYFWLRTVVYGFMVVPRWLLISAVPIFNC